MRASANDGHDPLVVIVDDQSTGRRILEQLVCGLDANLQVASFGDGPAAIECILGRTPDLILTDYVMPGMDGIAFIRRVRELPDCADVPLIVVTIVEDRRIRYQALDAGATDFLNRPIDEHECRARCRNLLTLRNQQKIIRDRAVLLEDQVADATREIKDRERETLLRLAKAGEYRDEGTGYHVLRIAQYSRQMAQTLGLATHRCEDIELAAPMHDIGKVGIPDRILLKPGRLTKQEFGIMQRHSQIGYEILKDSPSHFLQLGATIALNHHEKFDGSGYPRGLAGQAIPIEARIVAVADVFDALTTVRPYKRAWPVPEAIAYIRGLSGSHFDPACVEAFLQSIDAIERIFHTLSDRDVGASAHVGHMRAPALRPAADRGS